MRWVGEARANPQMRSRIPKGRVSKVCGILKGSSLAAWGGEGLSTPFVALDVAKSAIGEAARD